MADWVFEVLDKKKHDRSSFDCGEPTLNDFLQKRAGQQGKSNLNKTFVAADGKRIGGFYSLSAGSLQFGEFPEEISRKYPKHPAPISTLGRLAVDKKAQGTGLGGDLLVDALLRSYQISREMGIVAVVVDAKNENAVNFYKHFGFQTLRDNSDRLFILIDTVRDVYGA